MNVRVLRFGLVLAVCLFLSASAAHAATGVIKLGIDGAGQQEISLKNFAGSQTYDVDAGVSIAFEFEGDVNSNFDIGLGMEIQSPRKLSAYEGKFQFIPIYMLIRLHPEPSDLTPYFIGQLGVAVFNGDDQYTGTAGSTSSGGHVGIGGGLVFDKDFQLELLLTSDSGSITYPYPLDVFDVDVVYTKATLSFGLRF